MKFKKTGFQNAKGLFRYFEYRDLIEKNPFNKIQIKFRKATILPKTIPLNYIESILANAVVTLWLRRLFFYRNSLVMQFILIIFIHCWWSCSYKTHIASLCQLRNNFFSKISHKVQYYQLTLKISTKKEPLISQKSQTLQFYLYSISPNCTILA